MKQLYFDGHFYKSEKDFPDLGSFIDSNPSSDKWEYIGLSIDIEKLPTRAKYPEYSDLTTGSSALCVDTKQILIYNKSNDTWYKF